MDDDLVAQFTGITAADTERAQQYLQLTDGNLEHAVQLYFDNGGADMGASASAAQPSVSQHMPTAATRGYTENDDGTVTIDDDGDDLDEGTGVSGARAQDSSVGGMTYEDDEAMARRLQEEAYGAGGGGRPEDVRAPMARTTETLVGPGGYDDGGADDMRAAIAGQMFARQQRRQTGRPGIFNQAQEPSVWEDNSEDPEARRRALARATGGASETSSKSNLLAELFRPPVDLIAPLSWDEARDEGKEEEKWILVNIQDPSIFDCQVLNRDIWKNASIRDTVKENFIFMQYNKDDPRGGQYVNYYFQDRENDAAYPHIAIVDPRTGEQVKVWSGSPAPKPSDFLMDLHEFLDRYSLNVLAKNPVANRKAEKKAKPVEKMTEEEMLQMAMQNSLANGSSSGYKSEDPDALTKGDQADKDKAPADPMDVVDMGGELSADLQPTSSSTAEATPFSNIASDQPHTEPTDATGTTRIQFRWSGGRVVRKFLLTDQVRRIYEWIKAAPFESREGVAFELIFMGRNLVDALESTIDQAGLKNGSIMVEFLED